MHVGLARVSGCSPRSTGSVRPGWWSRPLLHSGRTALKRGPARAAALCVLLFPAYLYVALLALGALAAAAPPTFDAVLALADRSLVGDASFGVGRWLADHRAVRSAAYLAYQGAPVVMVAGAGLYRHRRPRRGFDVLVGVVVAGALGFALYSIVPAAGPIYRWGAAFPLHPPNEIAPALARADGYPNAMPSVHMACAIIMLAALWPVGLKERAFGLLFVALTVTATLGFGQHYLIDLIVAAPFGAMAWLVALRPPDWRRWSLACGALVVGWLSRSAGPRPRYRSERRVVGDDCRRGPQRWGAVVDEALEPMTSIAEYRASPTRVIELRRSVVPLTSIALLGVLIWRMPTDYAFGAYAFAGAALVFLLRASRMSEIVGVVAGWPAMTGAFFLAWAAWPFGRRARAMALLYLSLTVMATLSSGEHYLVDLVVAAPFALAIRLGLRREEPFRVAVLISIVAAWTILMQNLRAPSWPPRR